MAVQELTKIQKNWITLGLFVTISTALYFIYEIEFYEFLCEEEGNAPGCYVLYKEYEERGKPTLSRRYLGLSCELKYERACEEIEKIESRREQK